MLEPEERRLGAGGDELEECAPLRVPKVLLQDLPQPVDDPVAVVETPVVMCVLSARKLRAEKKNMKTFLMVTCEDEHYSKSQTKREDFPFDLRAD